MRSFGCVVDEACANEPLRKFQRTQPDFAKPFETVFVLVIKEGLVSSWSYVMDGLSELAQCECTAGGVTACHHIMVEVAGNANLVELPDDPGTRSGRVGQQDDVTASPAESIKCLDSRRKRSNSVVKASPKVAENRFEATRDLVKRVDNFSHDGMSD